MTVIINFHCMMQSFSSFQLFGVHLLPPSTVQFLQNLEYKFSLFLF